MIMAEGVIPNYTFKTGDIVSVGTAQSVLVYLLKYGDVVYGTIPDGISGSRRVDTVLARLPEGYRPKMVYDFVESYGKKRCQISTDGALTLKDESSTFIRGSFCYLAS